MYMYVSSWAEHGGAPGLWLWHYEPDTGRFSPIKQIDGENSQGFSVVDAQRGLLYVCNEVPKYHGRRFYCGRLFVYKLDAKTGNATRVLELPTECTNPSYISITRDRRYLVLAHHGDVIRIAHHIRDVDGRLVTTSELVEADLQLWRLDDDGLPVELVDNVDHVKDVLTWDEGHPHCCTLSPSGKLIAVADKGNGHLYLYSIGQDERLKRLNACLSSYEGEHPRYVVFHPSLPYLFVNHEQSMDGKCYVSSFRYDESGALERLDTIDVLMEAPQAHEGIRLEQQGFVISGDGRFLYTQINLANQIAVVGVDQHSGKLMLMQNQLVEGLWARALALAPDGRFLLSGCLQTGEVASYAVGEDGLLSLAYSGPTQPGASYFSFYQPE